MTDTERLDWMTNNGDMGHIKLDPDLEGQPVARWSVWNESDEGFTNPRDAIDAMIERVEAQNERMRQPETANATNCKDDYHYIEE